MLQVISDTSPLQYLHQAGLLHLLPLLYQEIVVPQAVTDELQRGVVQGIALPSLKDFDTQNG